MESVKLCELIGRDQVLRLNDEQVFRNRVVTDICTDTRSLKKGDLFVALAGERFDGHRFIEQALAGGAAGAVFSVSGPVSFSSLAERFPGKVLVGVADSRAALGAMAGSYRRRFQVEVIAVTGSVGKTTTKSLIHQVLSQGYSVVASPHSYNNDIGVPKSMLQIDRNTRILVQEIGTNHPGEIGTLSRILEQDHAVITAVGASHLEFFGSEENVAREKKDAVLALSESGTAFLNADDRHFPFLRKGLRASVMSFGLDKGDLHPARILGVDLGGVTFDLNGTPVRVRIPGLHGAVNAAAAALVGFHFGLEAGQVKRGVESFEPEPGRGVVKSSGGAMVIDESYNANPLSVTAALRFFSRVPEPVQGSRKIFIFGDMLELGNRSEQFHDHIGEKALECGVSLMFTFGEHSEAAVRRFRQGGGEGTHFSDMQLLIDQLRSRLSEGDLILVKGSRAGRLDRVVEALKA